MTMNADIGAPTLAAVGLVERIPIAVPLPLPDFKTWQAALVYGRAMFARIHYLDRQMRDLNDDVAQAQIVREQAMRELSQLKSTTDDWLTLLKSLA